MTDEMELLVAGAAGFRVLPCRAVLYDMDGTLVDSSACVEGTWRAWAARHGLDVESLLTLAHGRQNPDTIRAVAPHLDVDEECAFMTAAEEAWTEGIVPIAGARELLARMPADRWAIVTSAWRRLAEIRLGCAGLRRPSVLMTADEVARGKPHPEGYLMAAAALGVRPEACVVVEDAPAGVAAGRAAGMTVIGVTTSLPPEALGTDIIIRDLRAVDVRWGGGVGRDDGAAR
jgi:mannitol-1-/sugar-/sorbitol-6-phosphatase